MVLDNKYRKYNKKRVFFSILMLLDKNDDIG
jgi:hypothetical protein